MKKFSFSLQAVFNYKLTVEKTQKAELAKADAVLRELQAQLERLEESFLRNCEARERELLEKTADAQRLTAYDAYFRRVREERLKLNEKIRNAEAAKLRCQEALILTMKELKTYRKLREKQYQEYLKEVAADEEKTLSDIISYNVASGKE